MFERAPRGQELWPQTVFQRGVCGPHRMTGIDPNETFKLADANVGYPIGKRSFDWRDELGS